MTMQDGLKEEIIQSVATLPEETLYDVKLFLDYLQYRKQQETRRTTPFVPIALDGLWQGIEITDDDIAEARREIWANFGAAEN